MASSSSAAAAKRLSNISNHICPTDSNPLVKVSAEVFQALSSGLPVVALESTIISHGMPYPQNLETAKEVEAIVRESGAVPATIAILDGIPCIVVLVGTVRHRSSQRPMPGDRVNRELCLKTLADEELTVSVGLNSEQLERLARLGKSAQKTARRDIAYVVATKRNGATTVSATMFFAAMVGIPVFVTGGTGGVHRHGEHTMDISSDLTELGRTPVAVVSAGVKSILDIPRTLEYLETQGVCVAAYKTNEFPSFFTQTSGCKIDIAFPVQTSSKSVKSRCYGSDMRINGVFFFLVGGDNIDANRKLNLGNGVLIAVPIPKEHSASGSLMESAIQQALTEAREKNITGNAETPFLLARVNEITGGASLASSILER
ncbi:THO complex subunit 7-like protein isoform 1 [Hibiscus syriacus]|uniref:THO complex subunit 7-like protein isoform 1 n=1 Tax=Hibiscus syriacus TaxID=106335 RepID=A0A6A2XP50_HIBSY|nr:THO complex subunit 7-like protein isoform 1 [Hibiscus syriacus]